MKPDIFVFFSSRDYLSAWYEWKKSVEPKFSYRTLADQLPSISYNYLQRVIAGTRSLNLEYLEEISAVLALSKREYDYFDLLVQLDKCKSIKEKSLLTKRIMIIRGRERRGVLQDEQLHYLDFSYRPILRELAVLLGKIPSAQIGDTALPPLSAKEVRESMAFFLECGFLEESVDGYRQISPTLTTGDEISSLIVRNYHAETLRVLADLLYEIAPEDREISSLTFSVSRTTFEKMKEATRQFRKELIGLAQEDTNPEQVFQASFQLIPRSRPKEKI